MANESLMTLAKAKLLQLEEELRALKEQIGQIESDFLSAARTYGSELAGNDGGDGLRTQKRLIEQEIALLGKFLDGTLDIGRQATLEKNLDDISGQIATLKGAKELIEGEIGEIVMVKGLLA